MHSFLRLCSLGLGAGFFLLTGADSEAGGRIVIRRDADGDGHFNKKVIEVPRQRPLNVYYGTSYFGSPYFGRTPYGSRFGYNYFSGGWPQYRMYPHRYSLGYGYGYGYGPSYRSLAETSRAPIGAFPSLDERATLVQSALKEKGYYRGSLDGEIGVGSRAAIRAYQQDHDLPVTCRIDDRLCRSLNVP